MKKISIFCALLFTVATLQARTINVETAYTGSSAFDKAQVRAMAALNLNLQAGLEATLANEHRSFKKPVYSVAVPILLDFNLFKFHVRPFYYFKNKSDIEGYQDASAFGIKTDLILTLRDDTVDDIYTRAFLNASFARQKGTLFLEDNTASNQYYSQAAYTLGFEQAMFRAFNFRLMGTAFQYPDGISKVAGIRSVMDQQELANVESLEIIHQLARYTLGVRMARLWADSNSAFYVGYNFTDYYTSNSDHSILVGNSFPVTQQVNLDFAYNHILDAHNHNRRDIWQARVNVAF